LGLGLRSVHLAQLLRERPSIDWLELISENYLDCHGWRRHALAQLAEHYPLVMHGVSLSIGGCDPLDFDYLASLEQLASAIGARWISDHLCWTGLAGQTTHDLLPLALNETTLRHVIQRIRIVQDVLERPLVIENPSSYARFRADSLTEWEFLGYMAREADCGLLLDVNNVYVSSVNHGFDPRHYIDSIPSERVVQIHLAGHRHHGSYILDTHDAPVSDAVWELHRHAVGRIGPVATLLEWDAEIPTLEVLRAELLKARTWLSTPGAAATYSPACSEAPHQLATATLDAYPQLAGAMFETGA
jgi:hypothetical protein